MIWDKNGYLTGVPGPATQARRYHIRVTRLTWCRKPSKPVLKSMSTSYVSIISAEVYRK